jgi:hypothetical protein
MMSGSDKIFPILDRRAPVAERIRKRRSGQEAKTVAGLITRVSNAESEQDADAEISRFSENLLDEISSELDVDVQEINDEFITHIQKALLMVRDGTILNETTPEEVMEKVEEDLEEPDMETEEDGEEKEESVNPQDLTDENPFE